MSRKIAEFIKLMKEWDWEQNNKLKISPNETTHGSNKKAFWICSKNNEHKWQTTISSRTRNPSRGCPYCAGKKVNKNDSLLELRPDLKSKWDFKKNSLTGFDVTLNSKKKAYWICEKQHSYTRAIQTMVKSNKATCPYCSNRKIDHTNNLFFLRPDLKKEWDFEENNKIKLFGDKIAVSCGKKAHWVCSKGHKWVNTVNKRNNGRGCPYCASRKIDHTNNLFVQRPDLKNEWDFKRNNEINLFGDKVAVSCAKKAFWICSKNKNHKWSATINSRNKTGCPMCTHRVSEKETAWLDKLKIKNRQIKLFDNIIVDGLDYKTNTVYEFYGDYWHGNPKKYNPNDVNVIAKYTFGELYSKTIKKEKLIKQAGYNLITIWESDWDKMIKI